MLTLSNITYSHEKNFQLNFHYTFFFLLNETPMKRIFVVHISYKYIHFTQLIPIIFMWVLISHLMYSVIFIYGIKLGSQDKNQGSKALGK